MAFFPIIWALRDQSKVFPNLARIFSCTNVQNGSVSTHRKAIARQRHQQKDHRGEEGEHIDSIPRRRPSMSKITWVMGARTRGTSGVAMARSAPERPPTVSVQSRVVSLSSFCYRIRMLLLLKYWTPTPPLNPGSAHETFSSLFVFILFFFYPDSYLHLRKEKKKPSQQRDRVLFG